MSNDLEQSAASALHHLRQSIENSNKFNDMGDHEQSESVAKQFLSTIKDNLNMFEKSSDNSKTEENVERFLEELQLLLNSPSAQVLLDWLTLDLPKVILKFLDVSKGCFASCENIMAIMSNNCNAAEMMTVISEGLSMSFETKHKLSCLLFLSAFSIVVIRVKRRPVENILSLLPALLNAAKVVASEGVGDFGREIIMRHFEKLVSVAVSLQEVSERQMVAEKRKMLLSILAAYTLGIMALISRDYRVFTSSDFTRAPPLVLKLSKIIHYCGLSYEVLITGKYIQCLEQFINEDERLAEVIVLIEQGAILSVIWGCMHMEISTAAADDIENLLKNLQSCSNKRIMALSSMKSLISSVDYPLQIQKQNIKFILDIHNIDPVASKNYDNDIDWSSVVPSLYALLQSMQQNIVYTHSSELRRQTFMAFKKILVHLPPIRSFEILKAIIMRSSNSSMVSLLLGIVKDLVAMILLESYDNNYKEYISGNNSEQISTYFSENILQLLELIFKPDKGMPNLPEQCDAVLAALNLYRFLLIRESTGQTNITGILSKSALMSAQYQWLLPLRTLVSGIQSENEKDNTEIATSIRSALNLIELSLYHCLELVEECLKSYK